MSDVTEIFFSSNTGNYHNIFLFAVEEIGSVDTNVFYFFSASKWDDREMYT